MGRSRLRAPTLSHFTPKITISAFCASTSRDGLLHTHCEHVVTREQWDLIIDVLLRYRPFERIGEVVNASEAHLLITPDRDYGVERRVMPNLRIRRQWLSFFV